MLPGAAMTLQVLQSNSVQLLLLSRWIRKHEAYGCVAWWAYKEQIPGFARPRDGDSFGRFRLTELDRLYWMGRAGR